MGFLEGLQAEYGDISAFRLGHLRCCLIHHPELIEQVLVTRNDSMVKNWDMQQLRFLLGKGLLSNEGAAWKEQRRLIQPAFHNTRIRQYSTAMVRRTHDLEKTWSDGEERDVNADMLALTLNIVADALFGTDLSGRIKEVSEPLEEVMRWFEHLLVGPLPLPFAVPTPSNLRTRRALGRLDRVVAEIIDERKRAPGGDNLLTWLVEARLPDGSRMNDRQLRDEIVTLLLAGHETTALVLSWTIYLLAQHPEVAHRMGAEIDQVLEGRDPGPDDLAGLPFTRAVLQETMRLYPPAWGIGRECLTDVELGGYRIRRGTQIFMLAYATQRDSRWFEDPNSFTPERWAPDYRPPRYAYFPFGGGPRYCVGSNFAMLEATLLLVILSRAWRFDLSPEHVHQLQPSVTLRPRFGVRVRLRRVEAG
jgi:cytochrome P450